MSPTASADARNDHSLVRDDFEAATGLKEGDSESESSEHAQLAPTLARC